MKRTTAPKSVLVVRSVLEAEIAVAELRSATLDLNQLVASRDAAKAAVDERYTLDIAEAKARIDLRLNALQAYAETTPAIFPKDRKSYTCAAGTFGFRIDPRSVVARSKFTLKKALALCLERAKRWVRQSPELDKEAILAEAREKGDKFDADLLAGCGLRIAQGEKFYVDPRIEEPAKKAATAA